VKEEKMERRLKKAIAVGIACVVLLSIIICGSLAVLSKEQTSLADKGFDELIGQQPPNIIIGRPYLVHDLETDAWILNASGRCIVAWQPGTTTAIFFFIARSNETYIFSSAEVFNSTDSEIWGRWNVLKDGRFVCDRCIGHAYGLDEGTGRYFKLYIGNQTTYYEGWHCSGWIIRSRI
jgi:hypothetical protein